MAPASIGEDDLREAALRHERIQEWIAGKAIRKVIIVPTEARQYCCCLNASHAPSALHGEGVGDRGYDWYDHRISYCSGRSRLASGCLFSW